MFLFPEHAVQHKSGKGPAMAQGNLRFAFLWAFFEGLARTGSLSAVKWLGLAFTTLGEIFASTLILGFAQMIGAMVVAKAIKAPLWLGMSFLGWCVLFALSATVQTVIAFVAFGQEADLPVYIFIVVGLSMVPIALADVIFFQLRLTAPGWVGIAAATLGGYAMLGFPTLAHLMELPGWVLLALVSMLFFAANQALLKAAGRVREDLPKHVKALGQSTYVGMLTMAWCALGFMIFPIEVWGALTSAKFIGGSVLIGGFVVAILTGNSMALQLGMNMPIKNVVAIAVFLFGSAAAGVLLFKEQFDAPKLIGILCYFLAYFLIRKGSVERS